MNVNHIPDIGDISRIGRDANSIRDSELFRLPLQLKRIGRTEAIVADAENVNVTAFFQDAAGGVQEHRLSLEGDEAGDLAENDGLGILRDAEFPQHIASGAGRFVEMYAVRNHVHRRGAADEMLEFRRASFRVCDDGAAQPKIEAPDGWQEDLPELTVIQLPDLELAIQGDRCGHARARCCGYSRVKRGLQVRVDDLGAGGDDELPEPGDGRGERGGGAGELHDTQPLHGAGVRQADGVHPYARFRELSLHGSALALKRVFR